MKIKNQALGAQALISVAFTFLYTLYVNDVTVWVSCG